MDIPSVVNSSTFTSANHPKWETKAFLGLNIGDAIVNWRNKVPKSRETLDLKVKRFRDWAQNWLKHDGREQRVWNEVSVPLRFPTALTEVQWKAMMDWPSISATTGSECECCAASDRAVWPVYLETRKPAWQQLALRITTGKRLSPAVVCNQVLQDLALQQQMYLYRDIQPQEILRPNSVKMS